jgi:hypothetical protein
MKSIIQMAVIGGLLFGAAFAASYFLFTPKPEEPPAETENLTAVDDTSNPPVPPPDPTTAEKSGILPVAVRNGDVSTSVETLIAMQSSITKTEAALQNRERVLAKEEMRLTQLRKDIERERNELTAFSEQLEQRMIAAENVLVRIETEHAGLKTEKQELEALKKKMPSGKSEDDVRLEERVAMLKKVYESLSPDTAATQIKQMANDGEMKAASRLLKSLKPNLSSKILESLGDPILANQLLNFEEK